MFLESWEIPEIACAVEFLFTEAGAKVLYRIADLESF